MARTKEVPFYTLIALSVLAALTRAVVQPTNERDHKTDPDVKSARKNSFCLFLVFVCSGFFQQISPPSIFSVQPCKGLPWHEKCKTGSEQTGVFMSIKHQIMSV